jgi:hypothetical protein
MRDMNMRAVGRWANLRLRTVDTWNGGSRRSSCRRTVAMLLGAGLCLMLVSGAKVTAQSVIAVPTRANLNPVRVVISPNGIEVNPKAIRPGRVQILLENRTALAQPELLIQELKRNGQRDELSDKARIASRRQGSRRWTETTLNPGTYVFALASSPSIQTLVTVGVR